MGDPQGEEEQVDRKLKDSALNPRGRRQRALCRSETTGALRQEGMGGRQPVHCVFLLGRAGHI